jgi:hypothetical protein
MLSDHEATSAKGNLANFLKTQMELRSELTNACKSFRQETPMPFSACCMGRCPPGGTFSRKSETEGCSIGKYFFSGFDAPNTIVKESENN